MAHRRHVEHRPTKQEFFPATHASGGAMGAIGGFSGPDIDNTNEYGYCNFMVPWDFDFLVQAVLVFIATATATPMYVNIVTNSGQAGEAYTENNKNVALSVNTVLNRITHLDIQDALNATPLEGGDYVGVQASRLASLATENTDMILLGVMFRYQYR